MSRGRQGATTHYHTVHGHGPTIPRTRFAIPTTGYIRGAPIKAKVAPWFLKAWGSKPLSKQPRPLTAAA